MGASLLALAKSIYYFIVHSFTLFKEKPFKKNNKIACSPDSIYGSCKEGIEISASNVLPILVTLHNRRFMSQARRTRHCARGARWGEEKNKEPVTSPLLWLFRPPTPADGGDVKRTNQNTIHYSNIVIFLATRNTNNTGNNSEDKLITFNNVRLSVAKADLFSQSLVMRKHSGEKERGKRVFQTNSKVTSL